ncbi:adenylate kinase 7-like isoform X1 [Coccinella septempunctata]|uniref:adenylate kinase 7-like isoform X1 n=1 Tax=Coccinella septempunctata TaxID=41139 RepID=UPI001D08340B|nr:adenylate kinase 7-like isoform X1 [Coccinella septempunctata]
MVINISNYFIFTQKKKMRQSVNSDRRFSDSEPQDEAYHIFINNVDSFNGKYILSSVYKQGFEEVAFSEKRDGEDNLSEENIEVSSEKSEPLELEKNDSEMNQSLTLDQIINAKAQGPRVESKYKIFGSMMSAAKPKPEELFELTAESNEQFKNILTRCSCVIYDISLDDAQISKALTALSILEQDIERKKCSASKQCSQPVLFILISTCMTWALTTRMDPTDPDPIPFVEADYRRRKPHPNFKEHYDCERDVMKRGRKFKGKLQTIVVCSGITYGFEENMLAFLFKRAWSNDQYLPIFETGSNFVPLIHVADLAQVICKLIDMASFMNHYILAVEQTPTSLKYIVKYISRELGSGRIDYVVAEEAYLYPEIDHATFDSLTANIVMEPEYIITSLGITWRSEMNFVENIEEIVQEFKTRRDLEPLKIVVLGPPCSGKTKLAQLLCDHYNLHYISVKAILDPNAMKTLKVKNSFQATHSTCKTRSRTTFKECDRPDLDMEEIEGLLNEEDAKDLLEFDVQDSEEENYQKMAVEEYNKFIPKDFHEIPTRLSEEHVAMLVRNEMLKNQSQNLGFVVDGCPKSFRQASWMYYKKESNRYSLNSDDTSAAYTSKHDKRLIPNYVIDLDATNSFLLDRISRIPEEVIQNTHYNERDMIRRLMTYRRQNEEELGPLAYFHECETEIVEIDVSEFPSEDMNCIFFICTEIIGIPRGFGSSTADMMQFEVVNEFQEKLRKEKEELQKQKQVRTEKEELEKNMKKLLEKYHHENVKLERILVSRIEKYRIFLSEKILSVLFQAVMAAVENKPSNPLDFFAEYLFKNNPTGQMYNPRYSRNGETLIDTAIL